MVPSLHDLGPRIVLMGPSNSGKSTLAQRIGHKIEVPVIHLDLLRHETGSFDHLRPEAAFHADHARAIAGESWVMDGNYSSCLQLRLARATGLILLDIPTLLSLWRYLRRCRQPGARAGAFAGREKEPVRLMMLRHIIGPTRQNRVRYRTIFEQADLPGLFLPSPRAVQAFCRHEGL